MERSLLLGDIQEGEIVPPYSVELTLQRLVMEAGANRDFAPMHFDRDHARSEGVMDVFANTMLLQTLFEVMLRQWMGPSGRIRKIGFRMNGMNFLGQTLTAHGVVVAIEKTGEKSGTARLDIWQQTEELNKTVTGLAVIELPFHAQPYE
jgi:acyl dehydratase